MEENTEKKAPSTIELIEQLKETVEFQTLIENKSKEYWKSNIGSEVKGIYSNLDNAVKSVTGLEKPENVKTSDWIAENLKGYVEAKEELEALKAAKGESSKEIETLYQQKLEKVKNENAQLQESLKSLSQKGFESKIENEINLHLVGKTLDMSLSDDMLQDIVSVRKARMKQNSKQLENGKIVYYKDAEKTQPFLGTLDEPMTTAQVADIVFGSLYHTAKKGGGANGDAPETQAAPQGEVVAIDMSEIKSRKDFYNAFKKIMAPKGLTSLDKEFQTKQRATMEHYKIEALPL